MPPFFLRDRKAPLTVSGLNSEKVWTMDMIEKKEDKEKLEDFRTSWRSIQKQVLELLDLAPDSAFNNTHAKYDLLKKEKQLVLMSPGYQVNTIHVDLLNDTYRKTT